MLERQDLPAGKIAGEIGDVRRRCPAKAIYRLTQVANHPQVVPIAGKSLQQHGTGPVHVLVLVDEDRGVAPAQLGEHLGLPEHLNAPHDEAAEVDKAMFLEELLIGAIHARHFLPALGVRRVVHILRLGRSGRAGELHVAVRCHELVLRPADGVHEVLEMPGRIGEVQEVVEPERGQVALEEGNGAYLVEDREISRQLRSPRGSGAGSPSRRRGTS